MNQEVTAFPQPRKIGECLIIDGKAHADYLFQTIKKQIAYLKATHHLTPGLAVIQVGDNEASRIYVRNKIRRMQLAGMNSFEFHLPQETLQKHLITKIENLNNDPKVHGILVQLPLPSHIDAKSIINAIDPTKDVDGFHVTNVGKLVTGQSGFIPCTPLGCRYLLRTVHKDIKGKKAVVIGRSTIVGKPMSLLLLQANCTVTMTHSHTIDLMDEVRQADIIVAAAGVPHLVKREWIKPGATIIDVGISRIPLNEHSYQLKGDVDYEEAVKVAGAITPVPGGVGPMTVISLLANTIRAATEQRHLSLPFLLGGIYE